MAYHLAVPGTCIRPHLVSNGRVATPYSLLATRWRGGTEARLPEADEGVRTYEKLAVTPANVFGSNYFGLCRGPLQYFHRQLDVQPCKFLDWMLGG